MLYAVNYDHNLIRPHHFDEVEARGLTVLRGAGESRDSKEKDSSPKLIVFSVLFAGSAVKSCRTVSINYPIY